MDKKKKNKIFIISAIVVFTLLVFVLLFVFFGASAKSRDIERHNMLALAEEYIKKGDYDRALNLLDSLIIKNAMDSEARALHSEATSKKAEAKEAAEAASRTASNDKDSLAQSLGELGKSLERSVSSVAVSSNARSGSQDSAASALAAKKAEEEARARAEAEAEAKRKKALEEELARKSSEMRALMESINNLVRTGSKQIQEGAYKSAKTSFDSAISSLPQGEAKFAANTYSDIAEAYYEGYKREPSSPDGLEAVKMAQRTAQEAIRSDPEDAQPHYTLSKIYNDFEQADLARMELEQAVKLDPNNYVYAYELGKAYFKVKKYQEAQRAFESITTKLNPKFEPAFFNLGMTYRAMKNDQAALVAFGGAIKLKPDYVRAHIETARIQTARNDNSAAIKSLQTALSFEADNSTAMKDLAVALLNTGKTEEAERYFEKAQKLAPDAITSYNLAKVKYDLGKYSEALTYSIKATEAAAGTAIYYYQLGLSAEKLGDVDRAISAYNKAMELDKKLVDARVMLGALYASSGFLDKALSVLEEAYRLEPKSASVNNNLANAYLSKSLFDKAVFHYENALELAPRDPVIRLNLARAYVQAGSFPKARDSYLEIIKLDGKAWDAMFELGKVYLSMSDNEAARKILTELLAKKPDYKSRAEVETILARL